MSGMDRQLKTKFQEEVMEVYSIVGFFQKGGLFMYPILLVFLAGLAITVERWIQLNRTRSVNRKMWNVLHSVLAKGDFEKAKSMISKDDSTISQMLGMGLARMGVVRRREDIEIAMEESMMEIIPQLEKRTPYVALFSNIATLLGLLGTIMGLIEAFTAVANANPAEKADLLSASISVAMNTTAFGLMAAIPLLLFHSKLTSTTGQIVDSLEMASVKALNSLSDFNKRHFEMKSEIPDENGQVSNPESRMDTHCDVRCNNELNIETQEG
jgi:biopolymer transport protein ExbB